jgi:hypothetical protein
MPVRKTTRDACRAAPCQCYSYELRRMMMNRNTQANGATFLLLLAPNRLSSPSWTSRAVALNEPCPTFGVSWSPVRSRQLIDSYHDRTECLLPVAVRAFHGAYWSYAVPCEAGRSSFSPSPTIRLSSSQFLTSRLCLTLTLLPNPPTSN